jgi:C4-dicarboxylate transporter, DctQ subunit
LNRIARYWDLFQDRVVENVSRIVFLAIILLAFVEVVRRYVFGSTFIWYQDVAVYFVLAAIFIYFASALRADSHIRLSLVVDSIRARGGEWARAASIVELTAHFISLVFCTLFVWYGVDFVKAGIRFGRTAEGADFLPLWPFYIVLLIGFAFLAIEFARRVYAGTKNALEERKS